MLSNLSILCKIGKRVITNAPKSLAHFSTVGSKIGFIGLGNMGGPMASNLAKKSYDVLVFDSFPDAAVKLEKEGAKKQATVSDVAKNSDILITMLPNKDAVLSVYNGDNGILKSMKPGSFLVDCSTIEFDVAKQIGKLVSAAGSNFVDAPVSGGVNAAKAGTLTFMVGGKKDAIDSISPVLMSMGKNVIYCGDVGSGQIAKICNNMLLAIHMIGTAEALNLGVRLGVDSKLLTSVINVSSGRNWSSEVYNPVPGVQDNVPSSNNYEGGFGTILMTKDLGLAQSAATQTATPVPLGSLAHQVFRLMTTKGYGNKDFSSVFAFLKDQSC